MSNISATDELLIWIGVVEVFYYVVIHKVALKDFVQKVLLVYDCNIIVHCTLFPRPSRGGGGARNPSKKSMPHNF